MGKYSTLPLFVSLFGLGVVVLLSLCAQGGDAFVFVIPPREELCVYENAKPHYFVTVQFQVLEGGHQDVDIKVRTFDFNLKNSHCCRFQSLHIKDDARRSLRWC